MKKVLVTLIISSILLTQCYTQNEYLTRDYTFGENDKLKKVVLGDSTVREFTDTQYRYKIESDSLLITYVIEKEQFGEHTRLHTVADKLALEEIHSFFMSEYNGELTSISIFIGGLAILGIIIWVNGGIMGGESPLGGMGSF